MKFEIRIHEWESWGGPTVYSSESYTIEFSFSLKDGLQIVLSRKA